MTAAIILRPYLGSQLLNTALSALLTYRYITYIHVFVVFSKTRHDRSARRRLRLHLPCDSAATNNHAFIDAVIPSYQQDKAKP